MLLISKLYKTILKTPPPVIDVALPPCLVAKPLCAAPRSGGRAKSTWRHPLSRCSSSNLIVTHTTPGGLAAKRATTTIPIVIALIGEAVTAGIVANLAQPGGNITGQSFFNPELRAKRIELLKEVMPQLTHVAVIINVDNPASGPELQAMETAAQALNIKLQAFRLREASELVSAFEQMEQTHAEAVETGDDPVSIVNVGAIVALAARGRLLSIGPEEVPRAGGIIGYGADIVALFRHAAYFVDRILKGANPPIFQSSGHRSFSSS